MRWLRVVLVVAALTAAGGAGRGEATGSTNSSDDQEDALLAFTECMREQGIDLPDPETAEGGRGLRIRRENAGANAASREEMDEAREACEKHLEGVVQELTPEEESEMQDNMLAFAACMRENGVDMPDPDFSAEGGPRGAFRQQFGANPDDPDFQEAEEKCSEDVFEGQGPGKGGGPRVFFGGGRRDN